MKIIHKYYIYCTILFTILSKVTQASQESETYVHMRGYKYFIIFKIHNIHTLYITQRKKTKQNLYKTCST